MGRRSGKSLKAVAGARRKQQVKKNNKKGRWGTHTEASEEWKHTHTRTHAHTHTRARKKNSGGTRTHTRAARQSLRSMTTPWVGYKGKKPSKTEEMKKYGPEEAAAHTWRKVKT